MDVCLLSWYFHCWMTHLHSHTCLIPSTFLTEQQRTTVHLLFSRIFPACPGSKFTCSQLSAPLAADGLATMWRHSRLYQNISALDARIPTPSGSILIDLPISFNICYIFIGPRVYSASICTAVNAPGSIESLRIS